MYPGQTQMWAKNEFLPGTCASTINLDELVLTVFLPSVLMLDK